MCGAIVWTRSHRQIRPYQGRVDEFDLPTRGHEIRQSRAEKDGVTKGRPIYRDRKMGVMTLRSEADIAP